MSIPFPPFSLKVEEGKKKKDKNSKGFVVLLTFRVMLFRQEDLIQHLT